MSATKYVHIKEREENYRGRLEGMLTSFLLLFQTEGERMINQ